MFRDYSKALHKVQHEQPIACSQHIELDGKKHTRLISYLYWEQGMKREEKRCYGWIWPWEEQ